jgi:aryl-alcohol dehydrogenase-like predicted oxidoreductase
MKYRNFGTSDLTTSIVGFGVWTVSTSMWGVNDHDLRLSLLRRAKELGITFYDTADVYGDGTGETILRDAFGDSIREITVSTKFGYDWYSHPGLQPGQRERPHDWSPAFIRKACEESLKRLGTDRIDLYQLHNPRVDAIHNDELWSELDRLKADGKIRHVGVALGPAIHIRQKDEAIEALDVRGVTSVQIIYNLLEQMLGPDVFATAKRTGGGVMCRVPHASGVLEGEYTTETEFAPGDHRQFRVKTTADRRAWLDRGLLKVEKLDFLTRNTGRTISQAALQFIWDEPTMACALPNIYDLKQLEEFASAADAPSLSSAERDEVDQLYRADFGLEPLETEPVKEQVLSR